ncbi:MAG: FMN-binding negative transcriptional regulator [Actinomycetota bacterium]|nr:FMN-binding negative transcriptional regulator [Actinomycetota bacterium]
MLIHPWDAALDDAEWQEWLASHEHFGILAVNNLDPAQPPVVVPTHFSVAGGELLIHLARPNPVWPHMEVAALVNVTTIGDYAYIPSYWRAKAGGPDEDGVPTSYYSAVQFTCRPRIVDDPAGKVEILAAQLAEFQPEGGHAPLAVDTPPYGRMLTAIRGAHLEVLSVGAKFKYDDANPVDHRERVITNLQQRDRGLDAAAAAQQRRRLATIGDWRARKDQL